MVFYRKCYPVDSTLCQCFCKILVADENQMIWAQKKPDISYLTLSVELSMQAAPRLYFMFYISADDSNLVNQEKAIHLFFLPLAKNRSPVDIHHTAIVNGVGYSPIM